MSLVPSPDPKLTRRKAIASLAMGSAIAIGSTQIWRTRRPRVRPVDPASGWYALISDSHIAIDPQERLRGECMADNLRVAISDIGDADEPPRCVLFTGDLAFKQGNPGDYATLRKLVEPIERDCVRIATTPGNHDDREQLRFAFSGPAPLSGGKLVSTIEGPDLRFVILDSQDGLNVTAGRLGPEQIAWLTRELDSRPGVPSLVVVHHNPDASVRSGLRDADSLLAVVRARRQVKGIIFGHTHAWGVRAADGIHLINLPSTGYIAKAGQPLGWLALLPRPDGADLSLRCVSGNRRDDLQRVRLHWRA